MQIKNKKIKIGIMGCGAIGSRIAESVKKELNNECELCGLFDIKLENAEFLAKKLLLKKAVMPSLAALIKNNDLIVEAINAQNTRSIIRQILEAKKNVLVMSVGKLLNASEIFSLAKKNKNTILLPSGAIAGIDAIKAASLAGINKITFTTRKPPTGFKDNPYFIKKKIDILGIKKETIVFDGCVDEAVKAFPRNINVAATVALACGLKSKLNIRIIISPRYKLNSHEIEMTGAFGRMITRTENVICPDNPKTSYLAVLSGIMALKQFCSGIIIGT